MTPAARLSAAIDILDLWLEGRAPEQVLTTWARQNRYAGSKDRAAIRDLVYDALRCRRSFAALGGGETGRGLVLGGLRAAGQDPATLFTGERFAPAPLSEVEQALPDPETLDPSDRRDMPDWLMPLLSESLGDDLDPVCEALRHRAPVFLRANAAKTTRDAAQAILSEEGVETRTHPLSPTALEVTEGQRRVHMTQAFAEGLVELQDAASQAVVDALGVEPGQSVLDYCTGGGGKALALAAAGAKVTAHDIDAGRMSDLPERAARAGVSVERLSPGEAEPGYDLVFADAPCSGSGSWRRAPQGKWALTEARLDELCAIQSSILADIATLAGPAGRIAYATCSLFDVENRAQVDAFLARTPGWGLVRDRVFTPLDGADGFYVAVLAQVT